MFAKFRFGERKGAEVEATDAAASGQKSAGGEDFAQVPPGECDAGPDNATDSIAEAASHNAIDADPSLGAGQLADAPIVQGEAVAPEKLSPADESSGKLPCGDDDGCLVDDDQTPDTLPAEDDQTTDTPAGRGETTVPGEGDASDMLVGDEDPSETLPGDDEASGSLSGAEVETLAAVADTEPGEQPVFPPALVARRPGRALAKAEPKQKKTFTAEQRLMLLDTWRRSGLPAKDFAALVGVSKHTLYKWNQLFEEHGPAGLADQPRGQKRGSKLPELTRRAILMLKQSHPAWGCQRISDMLGTEKGTEKVTV